MASTRLRKTFKYPSDGEDSQGSRDELDEQAPEQEDIIANLSSKSYTVNITHINTFTILSLGLIPLFVYQFFHTSASIRMLCLLSITSLLASSFTMFFMSSIEKDARQRLDERQKHLHRTTFAARPYAGNVLAWFQQIQDKLDDLKMTLDVDGPLLKALPWLNGLMAVLLALASWLVKGKQGMEILWIYFMLPGIIFGMVSIARKSIVDEQKELRDLRGLRYGYKGA